MDTIKRKICLEDCRSRNSNNTWGIITANTFTFNIFLEEDFSNIGIFDDIEKITNESIENYFTNEKTWITGTTISQKEQVKTYNSKEPYKLNFNVNNEKYVNYTGNLIDGVSTITSITSGKTTYSIDGNKTDVNLGKQGQKDGILYIDTENTTTFGFESQGLNITNTSLSAITKQEYLMGVTDKPKVKSSVFIDRPPTKIYENHYKISEITNINELVKFQNGYFNIIKN